MPVNAVQTCEPHKRKNASYLKSGVVGALVSYSLKYIIPITSEEKDTFYSTKVAEIEDKAQKARLKEINLLAPKAKPEIESLDKFIYICDGFNTHSEKVKAETKLSSDTMDLIYRVNNTKNQIKQQEMKALKATIKRMRPTGSFIVAGASIGLITALIRNVSHGRPKEKH